MGFDRALQEELDGFDAAGLARRLRPVKGLPGPTLEIAGRAVTQFSSNDYLGLAGHPALREAAARAALDWGAGSGASRLVCGSLGLHHELEAALAAFKQTPAALAFATGYAAATGTIGALTSKGDILIVDKLVHACCIDGARLSGATLRVYRHNDLDDLQAKLQWAAHARDHGRARRILVVTESVFSMDGDLAPLRDIIELKDRHGAWLMVDEAHATGLYGENRRGLVEEFQVAGQVEIQMGTLGKALGAGGGYIAGSRPLIDLLVHRARSFVFSTAPVPAQAGAALAALALVQSAEGETRRHQCWANVDAVKNCLIESGWSLPPVRSAILPLIVGGERPAVELAAALLERNLLVPAIRYPTVPRHLARLRLTVSAAHASEHIQKLAGALAELRHFIPPAPGPGLG